MQKHNERKTLPPPGYARLSLFTFRSYKSLNKPQAECNSRKSVGDLSCDILRLLRMRDFECTIELRTLPT